MTDSNTTLRPPWLGIARVVWIVLALAAMGLFVVGAVTSWSLPPPVCTAPGTTCTPYELSQEDYAVAQQLGISESLVHFLLRALAWFAHLIWVVVALLLFWRKSDNWMAWLLSLMMVLFVFEGLPMPPALQLPANLLYGIATAIFMLLPYIFPTGRIVPRWMRWVAVPLVAVTALSSNGGGLNAPPLWWLGVLALVVVWLFSAGYAAIYRYRHISNAIERQQTKWIIFGILSWALTIFPIIIITIFLPPTQPSPERLWFVIWVAFPIYVASYFLLAVCILIAVFRYRLWDIDVLIRKTLTYAIVVALLAAVYFGSIILLQQVFATVSGQRSEIITVLSTLAIAALFVPLRNRVQRAIDRRFYRKKYDAQRVMENFSHTVRDETDLEKLTGELVHVVQETMQPKSVSVWLRADHRPQTADRRG